MSEQSFPSMFHRSEWTAYAVCARDGAPSMFPDASAKGDVQAAKEECMRCPVLLECLSSALDRGEQHGVWGGLTTEERKLFRRRQQRNGRPINDIQLTDLG